MSPELEAIEEFLAHHRWLVVEWNIYPEGVGTRLHNHSHWTTDADEPMLVITNVDIAIYVSSRSGAQPEAFEYPLADPKSLDKILGILGGL
jgi:hypothetical protein